MKKKTVQSVAKEMLDNFEYKSRNDGSEFWCNKVEVKWQKDIIRSAHDGNLPDDYIYDFIHEALCTISDCDEGSEEDAIMEIEPDCYTSALTKWLASSNSRVEYLNRAIEEFSPKNGFSLLATAQQIEMQEVAQAVLEGIKEYIEEL